MEWRLELRWVALHGYSQHRRAKKNRWGKILGHAIGGATIGGVVGGLCLCKEFGNNS